MGNRFDFGVAQEFAAMLTKTAEVMKTETENVNHDFEVLGDTFRDQNYTEFRSDVKKATATVNSIVSDLHELKAAMLEYASGLEDVLR